ncbi:SGNH/GDSL hydrolase family protein [Saccharopolyspora erythraea]|uniref:SGNH/GDSL hydrolase family protein n=1 Tax=Saccharopolyspora erythraea TaxID=1836 RepID=UPI001BAD5BA1|nr:SGNH/GDSL hydrolase family protein [Saccharopolyspora erythraea]QUG99845.1 SGNH/GDSL hydrolase family protein [Saccharopolyspora erythraea]
MGGWEQSSAVDATSLESYVALGDSFTEGMEDARPDGGYRGWADRLAERLAVRNPGLRYANLAVRGKLIRQIVDDQVPEAIELRPGLVSFTAGGNDIIRPGSDPDAVAELFESAVAELSATGARLLIGTGFDTRDTPVLKHVRGKIGTYNSHLRAIADKYDCRVIDLWSMQVLQDPRAWSADRLHLSPEGHRRVALRAAEALGLPVAEDWREPWPPRPEQSWRTQRIQDIQWAREYLAPWIGRRLRGQSSGDGRAPKRPKLERLCGAQSSAPAASSEAERC